MRVPIRVFGGLLVGLIGVQAQEPRQVLGKPPEVKREAIKAPPFAAPATYALGPEDQISIWVSEAEDISSRSYQIDSGGFINLPLVGRIQAAGQTAPGLEAVIAKELSVYYKDPKVAVSVTEVRSQPVSVIGSVATPGVHQIRGRKTLIEVLSLAGGLRQDAGAVLKITRRMEWGPVPLPGATTDTTGQYSVAEVPLQGIIEAVRPSENIDIRPNDVVSVPKADIVYVVGEVPKSGGFVLNDRKQMSVLQALAMAGGLSPMAAGHNARLLRNNPGSNQKTEIQVDLRKVLSNKAEDLQMKADDILFVPTNASRKVGVRVAEAAVQAVTGAVIWRSSRY